MADTSQPQNTRIILAAIFASVLLFFIGIGLTWVFNRVKQNEIHVKVELAPAVDLQNLRNYEAETLFSYGMVDKVRNVVRIPIDRAIELEARRPWRLDETLTTTTLARPKSNDGGTTHGK